jgi:hypothetical protein
MLEFQDCKITISFPERRMTRFDYL